MSQFCIITGTDKPEIEIEGIELLPLDGSQELYQEVIEHYRLPTNETWVVVDKTGNTIDEIFSEASNWIASGEKLCGIRLGEIIGCLLKTKCRIITWYGSEYYDLENINNPVELIDLLYKDLPVGSGEIYFDYK